MVSVFSNPINLKAGEKTVRYVFFAGKVAFDALEGAVLELADSRKITLQPKIVEYAISPTSPEDLAK